MPLRRLAKSGRYHGVVVFCRGQKVSCQAGGGEFRFGAGSNQGGVQR